MPVKKVIFDTDLGIDDAVALTLLLMWHKQGKIELLGIVSCFGNAIRDNVDINIHRILNICNAENIPVYKGAHQPFMCPSDYEPVAGVVHGKDGLGDVDWEANGFMFPTFEWEKESGAEFIVQTVNKDNNVTLISVGPLSNVALAYELDNDLFHKLAELIIMGGSPELLGNETMINYFAEHNFAVDPRAAHIVFDKAADTLCLLILCSWELTLKCKFEFGSLLSSLDKSTEFGKGTDLYLKYLVNFCRDIGDLGGVVVCDSVATFVLGLFAADYESEHIHLAVVPEGPFRGASLRTYHHEAPKNCVNVLSIDVDNYQKTIKEALSFNYAE
ncbi:hypothetical protein PCE1_003803 [Barthelona sp. PCE]